MTDALPIKHGRNQWLLVRTDRDAAQRDDVLASVPYVLQRWLCPASPVGMRSVVRDGAIGAARNLRADVTQRPDFERSGAPLARFEDCPTLRQVVIASEPWFVRAAFDWHGSDTRIPWPRLGVDAYGRPSDNDLALDWLLLEACAPSSAADIRFAGVGDPAPADNTVVRENPLPVGRYWVVVTGADLIDQFNTWIDDMQRTGALTVNSTQVLSQGGIVRSKADLALLLAPILGAVIAAERAKDKDQVFVVFTVTQPGVVTWPGGALGLPSRAAEEVTTVDQVEQAPHVPSAAEQLDEITGAVKSAGSGVLNVVAIGLGVVAVAGVAILVIRLASKGSS